MTVDERAIIELVYQRYGESSRHAMNPFRGIWEDPCHGSRDLCGSSSKHLFAGER